MGLPSRLHGEPCGGAMHILWDPQPEAYADEATRDNTIAFLVRGLLPDTGR